MAKSPSWSLQKSLVRHGAAGAFVVVGLVGGLVAWSATTEISGAVIAGGMVSIDGGAKKVQHQEGGIVSSILVRDEDVVKAGQVLVRLDGTTISANLEVVVGQLRATLARQARLLAESRDATLITLPPSAQGWAKDAELARLLGDQDRLMLRRNAAREGRKSSALEQIRQLELQIQGLDRSRAAAEQRMAIAQAELTNVSELYSQGLVVASRQTGLEREHIDLESQLAQIESQLAQAAASVEANKLAMIQADDEYHAQLLEELQSVDQEVARLMQQKIAAEDRLARLDIIAPIDGIIHEMSAQTVGGIAGAGETLMTLVPSEATHLVEARLSPMDINKVTIGHPVRIKLSSLDPKQTPELMASVKAVSPDLVQGSGMNDHHYLLRIDIPESELARLPQDTRIVPGMPVDVFVQTGQRNVLSYLMQPLADQLSLAFSES